MYPNKSVVNEEIVVKLESAVRSEQIILHCLPRSHTFLFFLIIKNSQTLDHTLTKKLFLASSSTDLHLLQRAVIVYIVLDWILYLSTCWRTSTRLDSVSKHMLTRR
jgi:hypothetical protein